METINNKSILELSEDAKLEIIKAINERKISYEVSEIADYLKNKGLFSPGDKLNDAARIIFEEVKDSVTI
ncbi:MAG: hypothetical protein HY228_00840 [Candidatus Yonathbacteria bacterium]|nr:hypothetical protein [Candidatus Yonathbacteria bacterium]